MKPARGGVGAALLALLGACSDQDNRAAAAPPGLVVTLQSEDAIGSLRPELTLSCNAGRASFWLEIAGAREPIRPRTLGTFKLDDGAPVRLEFTYLAEERWAPRMEEAQERSLVQAMAAARNIYFTGPEGRTDRVIRWDLARLGGSAGQLRQACAPIPGPP